MPTKDGISGTGIAPGRTHTRRVWRADSGRRESDLTRVIAMLMEDHVQVDTLFKRIEMLKKRGDPSRYEGVAQVCEALTVHLELEEALFYPAARKVAEDEDSSLESGVDEGEVEHAHISELIDDLKTLNGGDPLCDALLCDAKVKVLMDYVRHHVKEEESELFPALKRAKPDFTGLYDRMVKRREELEQHGMAAAELAMALAKENTYAPH